jgi:hypothetical protein
MFDIRQASFARLGTHPLTWSIAAWFFACGISQAQQPIAWKTGPALRKQLEASVSLAWSERPLRDGLVSLSHATGVCVFLDRRIDPTQEVELSADEPLERLLESLATKIDAKSAVIGPVVYLGPRQTAGKLSTLAALRHKDAAALPVSIRSRLLKAEAWKWDELTEPKILLEGLAAKGGLTIANADLVPHDLWPAADLPAMAWVDRLTLLLAGFGLTFEFADGGQSIRLAPIPDEVLVEKTYTPRGEAGPVVAQLRRLVPDAKIHVEGRKLLIAASTDDHDKIQRLLSGQTVKTTNTKPGEKRYSMTVENQAAGAVVKTVANQLGKEMKYDPRLTQKLQTKVSFVVMDITLDELLKKTLAPLELGYKLDDSILEIVPAE